MKNPRQMRQQIIKVEPGSVLGARLLASDEKIATGRSNYHPLGDPLGEKGRPKGRFGESLKIKHGSKIDPALWTPFCFSEVSKKHTKIR